MKIRADYIKELLSDMEWKDKGEICKMITEKTGGYGDSIARTLRKMTVSGILEKKEHEDKKGTAYRLTTSNTRNTIKIPEIAKTLF